MKFCPIDDPGELKRSVSEAIRMFGRTPEHSYDLYRYYTEPHQKRVFFTSEGGYGIMALDSQNGWEVLSEPLAPQEASAPLLAEFISFILNPRKKPITLDILTDTHEQLRSIVRDKYQVRVLEEQTWPRLDMRSYDPSFPGARFKSLRNVRSRFSREHEWHEVDGSMVSVEELRRVIKTWKSARASTEDASTSEYYAYVEDESLSDRDMRVLVVDGTAAGIYGGWPVPNSRGYYLFMAIHTYEYWGLGEMLMMRAIESIQSRGYQFVELGGSDASLLSFKRRFGDVSESVTRKLLILGSDAG